MKVLGLVLLVLSQVSIGQEVGVSAVQPDMLRWSGGLLVIMLIMGLCLWLIKRSGWRPAGGGGALRVIAAISLGARERLVVVQVGDKQLMLGVAPGVIAPLGLLEGDERLPLQTHELDFSIALQRYMTQWTQRG